MAEWATEIISIISSVNALKMRDFERLDPYFLSFLGLGLARINKNSRTETNNQNVGPNVAVKEDQ